MAGEEIRKRESEMLTNLELIRARLTGKPDDGKLSSPVRRGRLEKQVMLLAGHLPYSDPSNPQLGTDTSTYLLP